MSVLPPARLTGIVCRVTEAALFDDHWEQALILCKLAELAEAGELRLVLNEQRFTLAEAGKAHDRLASGQAIGKIVIEI